MGRNRRKIALFGGSFNPPHPAHFEMACYIYEALGVDEVWFLFSNNWQKPQDEYASPEHRMEMGRILAREYPDMPFVMSDIQDRIGTHITHEVLSMLNIFYPNTDFIWVMGEDNLESLHTWQNYEYILANFPIAITNRPGYKEKALQSVAAQSENFVRLENPKDLASHKNGVCILDNPPIGMSSSELRRELRAGKREFSDKFQAVAEYIRANHLYGVSSVTAEADAGKPSNQKPGGTVEFNFD